MMPSSSPSDIELRASYFQEFLLERQRIAEHKRLESERAAAPVSWENALLTWVQDHRPTWKKSRSRKSELTPA